MCAPNSAAILHDSDRYLASLFASSFPTAVTARTGKPYSSASFTRFPRLTSDLCSYLAPTKIDIVTAVALILIASLMLVVISSLERSSPMMLAPPDTLSTIGTGKFGSTELLTTPRVTISESQCLRIGAIVLFGT